MITKFNSASPPACVKVQDFTFGVLGYWVTVENNDIKLVDGDYILQDDDEKVIGYISAGEYALGGEKAQRIKETAGKGLLRTIWQTLSQSGLNDTVKASILDTISVTLIAILAGEVKASRIIANNTATTADFTNGRKNILLGLIDDAITKL